MPAEREALEAISLVLHEIVDALLERHPQVRELLDEDEDDVEEQASEGRRRATRCIAKCFVSCCS